MENDKDIVTICVVNYKTLELTKLCLRSIRKYTKFPYKVMVIDNDSQDESTEYLKNLDWIDFYERKDKTNDYSGGYAHASALDMGLGLCSTKYFMAMHSDTFIHTKGWLTKLMSYFQADSSVVCVGGSKCELTVPWRVWLKKLGDFKTLKRKLLRTTDHIGMHRYYNRTVCCIYRTNTLKKEKLSFLMYREKGLTVGKKLYFELIDRGLKTVELSDKFMKKYLWHLAHATQAINSSEFRLKNRTIKKTIKLVRCIMNSPQVKDILADDSLDNAMKIKGIA